MIDDDSSEDSDSDPDMKTFMKVCINDDEKNDNNNNALLKQMLTVKDTTQLCAAINSLKAKGININDKVAS